MMMMPFICSVNKEQWHPLWTGEQAFWQAVPRLLAAGHGTVEGLEGHGRH
jgi:hypothetical protein